MAKMKFETFKVANVSTRHIAAEDGAQIAEIACIHNEHGGLVPTDAEWRHSRSFGSVYLWDIVQEAHKQGFAYVWFDADGGDVDGAPEFEW